MRIWVLIPITVVALGLGSCTRESQDDADSAARKAGRKAHEVATKTEEAAKKAGRKLEEVAKDAREGWKEADREEKAKDKK